MKRELEKCIGKKIVLDTDSSWIYIGNLEQVTTGCAMLSEADVHDSSDTTTSKEVYVFESRRTGVKPNRERVYINLDRAVSFSLLDEVKQF